MAVQTLKALPSQGRYKPPRISPESDAPTSDIGAQKFYLFLRSLARLTNGVISDCQFVDLYGNPFIDPEIEDRLLGEIQSRDGTARDFVQDLRAYRLVLQSATVRMPRVGNSRITRDGVIMIDFNREDDLPRIEKHISAALSEAWNGRI